MGWEGAEICFYFNGESVSVSLSNTQLAAVIKLLGMQYDGNNQVTSYSDETLKRFAKMKGNPLRLEEKR